MEDGQQIRAALVSALSDGRDCTANASQCRGILNDVLGGDARDLRRGVTLVVAAVEEGIPSDLTGISTVDHAAVSQLVKRLTDRGIADEAAWWTVETWADVLGVPWPASIAGIGREEAVSTTQPADHAEPVPLPHAPQPRTADAAGVSRRTLVIAVGAGLALLIAVGVGVIVSRSGGGLSTLRAACGRGTSSACDDLYTRARSGSDDQRFGSTCGNTREPTRGDCTSPTSTTTTTITPVDSTFTSTEQALLRQIPQTIAKNCARDPEPLPKILAALKCTETGTPTVFYSKYANQQDMDARFDAVNPMIPTASCDPNLNSSFIGFTTWNSSNDVRKGRVACRFDDQDAARINWTHETLNIVSEAVLSGTGDRPGRAQRLHQFYVTAGPNE